MNVKSLDTVDMEGWVSGGELVGEMPGTLGGLDINYGMGGWVVKLQGGREEFHGVALCQRRTGFSGDPG